MSYRLIDNETNEDIIDKLSRIKDERDKYEKILDNIREVLGSDLSNIEKINSIDLLINTDILEEIE